MNTPEQHDGWFCVPDTPAIAVLGLVAAVIGVRMARTHERGILHYPLAGFAWGLVALAIVIPDSRPLMAVARAPIVLGGMPFGWPEGVGFFEPGMFTWPVANQLLIVLGGALWAATALAYQRRARRRVHYLRAHRRRHGLDDPGQRRPLGPRGSRRGDGHPRGRSGESRSAPPCSPTTCAGAAPAAAAAGGLPGEDVHD